MPVMLLAVETGSVLLAAPMSASGYAVFETPSPSQTRCGLSRCFLGSRPLCLSDKYSLNGSGLDNKDLPFHCIYLRILGLLALLPRKARYSLAWPGRGRYPAVMKYLNGVVDILGVYLPGVASMFGISLEPIPVILLLILLAVYDAISVYKTKHMLTLANGVIEGKMPIMVVVPKKEGYSFIRDGIGGNIDTIKTDDEEPKHDRAAYLMGLGDLIMPSILVTSACVFTPGGGVGIFSLTAMGTILGSLAGLGILMRAVFSGRPQAGLPPLNGGAIIGFLMGWFMMTL